MLVACSRFSLTGLRKKTYLPAATFIELNSIDVESVNHRDEAFSLMDSWTAFKRAGINFWFVTTIPVSRSRYLPFEKSRGFPPASLTTPPASAKSNIHHCVKTSSR